VEKYQDVLALAGRALLSAVMGYAALFNLVNWPGQVALLAALRVPLPAFTLGWATAVEIVLGVPLLLGFKARWAGFLLAVYVLVTTLFLHPFWAAGPGDRAN
jgi:putative oxidoreductase